MVAQKSQDLFIFALGPVQSFIVTARRTQDLWLGSQLLSNLALVGVQQADAQKASVVFPRKVNDQWPQSIPNRFVAAVPANQGQAMGIAITQAVEKAWQGAAQKVRGFFAELAPESGWQEAWGRQTRGWLETYWIAWPWDGSDYGTAYRQAGLALDARKQVRVFPTSAEPGETCTLCGLRQVLHGRRETRRQIRLFWNIIRQDSRIGGAELQEGEQLCAVCTVKRFAARAGVRIGERALKPADRFPSTSSIASATFKARVLENWRELRGHALAHLNALDALGARSGAPFAQPEKSDFLKKLAAGKADAERLLRYGGDFFYRESFALERLEDVLGRQPGDHDKEQAKKAMETLHDLFKAVNQLQNQRQIAPPHSYLAALVLDGDRMGQLLSESQTPDEHWAISDALVTFAQTEVPRIVEAEHAGRLVYAGGDDVLALLPVDHVLSAADKLRQALTNTLKAAGHKDRTASAGVSIVHHTHPLESALRAARHAEYVAKNAYNRNALVVEALRRSGESIQVGLNWSYEGGTADTLAVVDEVQALFAEGTLSSKIAYDLRHEAPALAEVPLAHEAELTRLLTRHWQKKPVEAYRSNIQALAEKLAELCEKGRIGIELVAEWLLIARFLAQGGCE